MSILSNITGRLPNLLETLQGTWTVEYKIQKDKTNEEPKNWLNSIEDFAATARSVRKNADAEYLSISAPREFADAAGKKGSQVALTTLK